MNKTGIYKIVNLVNGKCYVGSASNIIKRFREHKNMLLKNKHHSIKLQRAYNKYGINNFVYEIIEECEIVKETMLKIEQYYTDLYDSFYSGYNCTEKSGSRLGSKASEETKIKLKEARSKRVSSWNKGIPMSEYVKQKLLETNIGKTPWNKGKIMTDDFKLKISKAQVGRVYAKGYKHSDKAKEIMSIKRIGRKNAAYNSTPVLQYDLSGNFIKEWQDLFSTKESGFNSCKVSAVCRGKRNKHADFIWKFKEL